MASPAVVHISPTAVNNRTAGLQDGAQSNEHPEFIVIPWPQCPSSLEQHIWTPRCHRSVNKAVQQTDSYFLDRWPFPDEKSRQKFRDAGFSKVTCLYFPLAKDDRIQFACRLLTVLFLVDDILEHKSLGEGKSFNERLMEVSRGSVAPDSNDPAQPILHELWEDMRAVDQDLADDVMHHTFTFMRAQTDRARLQMKGLGNYLAYRERDVGKALLSALMRFSMDLRLTGSDMSRVRELEQNCSRQISVVNDIYSWEKEYRASLEDDSEGSVLCSAVSVLMDEIGLGVEPTKRVLWQMVREWEKLHDALVEKIMLEGTVATELQLYMKGLEHQMSGNEVWSMTTLRYGDV